MIQTAEQAPPTIGVETLAQLVADNPQVLTDQDGNPLVVLINYQLYLDLFEAIDEWHAGQRAIAAYEAWKKDPSRGRPWDEVEAELVAEGVFDA